MGKKTKPVVDAKQTNPPVDAKQTNPPVIASQTQPKQTKPKKYGLESDQDIKYWLLSNSRRDHAWIVELQSAEILANSRFLDVNGQVCPEVKLDLRYTYSAIVTGDYLLAIVEGFDGRYYLIRNRKLETDSDSNEDSEYDSSEDLCFAGFAPAGKDLCFAGFAPAGKDSDSDANGTEGTTDLCFAGFAPAGKDAKGTKGDTTDLCFAGFAPAGKDPNPLDEFSSPDVLTKSKKKKVIDEHTLSKLEKESIKFKVFQDKKPNTKEQPPIDELIESLVTVSDHLITLIRSMTQTEKTNLAIVKPQRMKLSKDDREIWDERLPLLLPNKPEFLQQATQENTQVTQEATQEVPQATQEAPQATQDPTTLPQQATEVKTTILNIWVPPVKAWLKWLKQQKESLDLTGMFWITDLTFENKVNLKLPKIHSLTINQNFRLTKFDWLATCFPNLRQIDIVNQASLKADSIARICQACPKLTEFSLHYCPQVNIRVLLDILKLPQIQKICLNQMDLVCQTNPYSGLVGPNEWLEIECPSLEKLLINSSNLTLDVIDYMMPVCPNLKRLVIHPTIAEKLRTNVIEMSDALGLEKTSELVVAGLNNKQFTIHRPFKIKGKLKDNFDEPFSDSMQKKIKAVYEVQDMDGFEDEDPVLLAEVMAEMRANGEL